MANSTIPYQASSGSISTSQFNQILDVIQNGLLAIKTSGAEVLNASTFSGGAQFNRGAYFDGVVDNGFSPVAGSLINWTAGNKQKVTLSGATTLVFTAPTGPTSLSLELVSAGSYATTFPASVLWPSGTAPSLSVGSEDVDIVNFFYNGTSYYGEALIDMR